MLQVLYYFNVYGALSVICIVLSIVSTPFGQWAGYRACKRLHEQLLAALMEKSLNFFQTTPLGRVMNRFSNDINVIDKVRSLWAQCVCTRNILRRRRSSLWFNEWCIWGRNEQHGLEMKHHRCGGSYRWNLMMRAGVSRCSFWYSEGV